MAQRSFGILLKGYRVAAGLTQEVLAERAGLSVRGISDLERDARRRPQRATVELLATALGLPPHERARLLAAGQQAAPSGEAGAWRPVARPGRPSRQDAAPAAPLSLAAGPPLVGRGRELALLERHLTGEGAPLLLLVGEPGIGKSRLLREAAAQVRDRGWAVLHAGCSRGGQDPYAPLTRALQRHLDGLPPDGRRAALAGCAWLVRLLPELAGPDIEPLPAWILPPEQERRLLFRAVERFVVNVAGPAGALLLLLDDLQWAGADALDLLGALIRADGEISVRVIGAYRDTEMHAQHPLPVILSDLVHAGLAARRLLTPLSEEEAARLLESLLQGAPDVSATVRERVLERAGGVPFFLVSCAQELRVGDLDAGTVEAVPWNVAQSVRQRVAALPEGARAVLGAASLVSRAVRHTLLVEVTARPEGTVLAALEAACEARLLEEQGRDGYRFVHDMIREVVEADLGASRRAVLHRHIAAALERLPGELPVDLLAYHYGRSDAEEEALPYLERAGERAEAQAAHAAAEGYYRELVGRLDGLGRAPDAARVREKLGNALATAGSHDAALAMLEQAAEAVRAAGDLEGLGRITARMGHIHYNRGTLEEGVSRLRPLLASLEAEGPTAGLAMLYTSLAELNLHWGHWAEELAATERAGQIARLVGDKRTLARAEHLRGLALLLMGRAEEALPVVEAAVELADAVGDLECLCEALDTAAWFHDGRGDLQQSRRYAERALLVAERLGDPVLIADSIGMLGALAFDSGAWDRAHEHYAHATTIHRQIALSPVSCSAGTLLLALGQLLQAEGAWEEAARYLEEGRAIFAPQGKRAGLRWAQSLLAERDILAGQPEAARARLVPLLDRWGVEEIGVTTDVLPALAWAYLEVGDTEQAVRTIAEAIRRMRAGRWQLFLVDALRVQALVAMRQGHWDEAKCALEEGMELAHGMPRPYAEGRLLHTYGLLHAATGESRAACEQLEAALAIFRRLGARKDAERAEAAIAALPETPRPSVADFLEDAVVR